MFQTPVQPAPWAGMLIPAGRALALAGGAFCLLNLAGNLLTPRFDANVWWMDLRPMPAVPTNLLLLAGGVALLLLGTIPMLAHRWRWFTLSALLLLAAGALFNAAEFYALLLTGRIHSSFPLPLSLLVAAGLLGVSLLLLAPAVPRKVYRTRVFWLVLATCPVAFPLLQMLFFGATDYRRPADAIVVFGARTYTNGLPSQALSDRVNTACDLYQQGLAPVLILSGGPGDGAVSEPMAMRNLALSRGIPASAMVLDSMGFNTQATVDHVTQAAHDCGYHHLLAVSHAYHLPRVKLCFQHAGLDVYTVPARESRQLVQKPKLIAREVPALWAYYLGPLGFTP